MTSKFITRWIHQVQLHLCLWLLVDCEAWYILYYQTFIPNLSILRSCRWVHHQIPTIYGRNLGRRIGQNVRAYFQCGSSLETFCLFHPQFDIIGRFQFIKLQVFLIQLRGGPNFDPVKYVKEVCHVKHMQLSFDPPEFLFEINDHVTQFVQNPLLIRF